MHDGHVCLYFFVYKPKGSCVIGSQKWLKDKADLNFWQGLPIFPPSVCTNLYSSKNVYKPARVFTTLDTLDTVILLSIY